MTVASCKAPKRVDPYRTGGRSVRAMRKVVAVSGYGPYVQCVTRITHPLSANAEWTL